jgi:predicted  nucleic acid-binding Zn-ribbon protein
MGTYLSDREIDGLREQLDEANARIAHLESARDDALENVKLELQETRIQLDAANARIAELIKELAASLLWQRGR